MKRRRNPMLRTDGYKLGHPFQYPEGTTLVYSNDTARKSRLPGIDYIIQFGLQYFMKKYLIEDFNENFFGAPKEEVLASYKRRIKNYLGRDLPSYKHIEDLHDLGYLPIRIKALPEGSKVPIRVPFITIVNTHPDFFWLTNFLETMMSCCTWQSITSATIASEYQRILSKHAEATGMPIDFVYFQGHDFSMRGMSSPESAEMSGAAHLLFFKGTDTLPAIDFLEDWYNADCEKEFIGGSVNATEHSVMCAGGDDDELSTYKRLIDVVYPDGIVSIVSDTWDLWHVLTVILPELKPIIMARDGKVVIRPDSGDPVDIICGLNTRDEEFKKHWLDTTKRNNGEWEGVVEILWNVFGGTINEKGYKVLDSHVGAIYGDSITPTRAEQMGLRLAAKGFASQEVLGIGSFTYQMNTRDTFGMAVKATYTEKKDQYFKFSDDSGGVWTVKGKAIFKDPVTDDGTKKSAKGLIRVEKENGEYVMYDEQTWEQEAQGELQTVFLDSKLLVDHTLSEIRERVKH